jgi:hypothetical protein
MKITFLNKDYFAYEHTDVEYCFGKMQYKFIPYNNIDSFVSENSCLCFSVRYEPTTEAYWFHISMFTVNISKDLLGQKNMYSEHKLQSIINEYETTILEKISYLVNNTDENAPEKNIAKDEFDKWMILL